MGNSGSPSSDLAKGKKFLKELQYVQHVDKEKDTASEIPELTLQDLLADDRTVVHDSNSTRNSTENFGNSESNLDILKSSLKERIARVAVCSNPLPIPIGSSKRVTFHAFVVFATHNTTNSEKAYTYWSLEKNGRSIVLQQSTNGDDVISKIYDADQKKSVDRNGKLKERNGLWEITRLSDIFFKSFGKPIR